MESDQNEINALNNGILLSNTDKELNTIYSDIRLIREEETKNLSKLKKLSETLSKKYPEDWLAKLEIYELIYSEKLFWKNNIKEFFNLKVKGNSDLSKAIKNSLQLIEQ